MKAEICDQALKAFKTLHVASKLHSYQLCGRFSTNSWRHISYISSNATVIQKNNPGQHVSHILFCIIWDVIVCASNVGTCIKSIDKTLAVYNQWKMYFKNLIHILNLYLKMCFISFSILFYELRIFMLDESKGENITFIGPNEKCVGNFFAHGWGDEG